jgi:hypothetical protein
MNNGDVYEGKWNNDKMEGHGNLFGLDLGTYVSEDGEKYDGEWVEGFRQGKGLLLL